MIHLLLALLALSPAQGAPAVDQVQAAAAPAPRNDANRVRVDFYGEGKHSFWRGILLSVLL